VTNRIDRTQHARGPVGHPVRVAARSRRRPCNELYDKAVLHAGNQLQALLSVVRHQIGRYELHRLRRDLAVREAEAHSAHLRRGELAHLFRVSRLSELSVSIGHEIIQPLQSILSNAQAALLLLAKDNPDLDEIREMLHDIVLDDSRAGEVIRELRACLKKIESPIEALDLNELVRNVLWLLHGELLSAGVSVTLNLGPELPSIKGQRIQLQQVLLNLIINGCEAMTDVDVSAAKMLEQLDRELNAAGIHMAFAEMRTRLQDLVRRYGLFETLDRDRFYPTLDAAIAAVGEQ